jgi:queuosine precursor transporter
MRIALYLIAIIAANIITAAIAPLVFGAFIVPMGTLFIGATFILRDLVQRKYGRKKTYMFISLALGLSAISSFLLGDTLAIVAASAISFLIAETTDTEIYTRLKLSLASRVFYSGLVGGLLDSAIFVVVGLSPVGAGFLPWSAVPAAILGQVIVKSGMQGVGALIIRQFSRTNTKLDERGELPL